MNKVTPIILILIFLPLITVNAAANPSAVYCETTYPNQPVDTCIGSNCETPCYLPDEQTCEMWSFYRGECGIEYSYCSKQGFTPELRTDNNNNKYLMCIFDDGSECLDSVYAEGNCLPGQCNEWTLPHPPSECIIQDSEESNNEEAMETYSSCDYFRSDNNYLYLYIDKILDKKEIDSDTFEVTSGCTARDESRYYAYDYYKTGYKIIVLDIDFPSFEELDQGYLKDKNGIYYNYEKLDDIDPASFEIVGQGVVKDKYKVYYSSLNGRDDYTREHYELSIADPATFTAVNDTTYKDKNNTYIKKVEYWSNKVYFTTESGRLDFGQGYEQKETDIYLNDKKIEKANYLSFNVLKFPYSKDSGQIFYFWDPIPGKVNLETFEILNDDYSKDSNKIYYKNTIVDGADVGTFKLNYQDNYQAEDEKNYYNKGVFLRAKTSTEIMEPITSSLFERLKGKIVLKVEDMGRAYYLNPRTNTSHYLGRPDDAFRVMREQGLGISEENYNKFNGYAPSNLSGLILLRVEANGEAYYVNPIDLKMHYLGKPADAFQVMRNLGLGISNNDFDKL